jgi:hypothetical protein
MCTDRELKKGCTIILMFTVGKLIDLHASVRLSTDKNKNNLHVYQIFLSFLIE